ncbi:ABC transporter substrate-binding protein [Pseudonocardia spinosispora]|uniref:ABC transporter substrate-binding protein n=1 Tax=Pseudonocardia spinosispora TaxID=103441 RepID=UPI00048FDBBF|nr:ABC transporter substrate-binding protein [Pseudonocardia spinosispora]
MNRLLLALAAPLTLILVASCAGPGVAPRSGVAERQQAVIRYQGQVGQVTFPELAADLGYLDGVRLHWIGNFTSGPQDIQAAVTGDTDVGGAFNGSILRLAAAGAPITAVIGYYGIDEKTLTGYFVRDGSPIRTARDLIGKTVGVNTLGAHYEDVLRIYLAKNGLTEQEINSVQLVVVPPISAEQALRSGQLDVAVLQGIYRDKALARGAVHPVFTDYDLLGTFTAGSYVLRNDFIAANPDTVRRFVAGTARAITWAQQHPRDEVVARMKQIVRQRGRAENTDALDYWHSTGVALPGGVIARTEFGTWLDRLRADGRITGSSVDLNTLYTNRFNPYAAPTQP